MALVTAPLSRTDNYPYRSLSAREMRLVIVKKHTHWPRANSLTCSIKHVDIDKLTTSDSYVAISYTWGDGRDVTSLKMTDESSGKSGQITVTSSLISALQTILEAGKRHTLWIDQISINQASTEDKGQQVQLMRWIYERATAVHIWLGPASDHSDQAMMYLQNSNEETLLQDFADESRTRFTPRLETATEALMTRPYWFRTWTLFKATALDPGEVAVSCGHSTISLQHFFSWQSALIGALKIPSKLTIQVEMLESAVSFMDEFRSRRIADGASLSTLVFDIAELGASDPRDKIYSMLSFANDLLHAEIKPDYTKTVRQAYTEFVLWFISKYRHLDILGWCDSSLTEDAVPSWVPDWGQPSSKSSLVVRLGYDDPSSDSLYQASGQYVQAPSVQQPYDFNTRLLLLSGVRVSKLDIVQNQVKASADSWAAQQGWQLIIADMICLLNLLPFAEVFRRTIYLDRTTRDIDGREGIVRGNEMTLPWKMAGGPRNHSQVLTVLVPKFLAVGRCPFYTKPCTGSSQGILGLGPDTARPDDELWILKGGSVPFVLRLKPMTIPSTDLQTGEAKSLPVDVGVPTYELVGEAFVLGLMDGEIIDMLGETPNRERPPPLADMDRDWRTIGLI